VVVRELDALGDGMSNNNSDFFFYESIEGGERERERRSSFLVVGMIWRNS